MVLEVRDVYAMIQASRPGKRGWGPWILCGLGVAMLVGSVALAQKLGSVNTLAGLALPWLVLLALVGLTIQTARRQKARARVLQAALEAQQLQQWDLAKRDLSQALAEPVRSPNLRAQALLALASVAEHERSYDAAAVAYRSVLEEQQANPFYSRLAAVGLAGAWLRAEQLADAVSLLDRLQRTPLPGYLGALLEATELYREVLTGRVDDAVASTERRRRLARQHLSTGAGYVYALLAWACHLRSRSEQAHELWADATMLIREDCLVHALPEVAQLPRYYPSSESPL